MTTKSMSYEHPAYTAVLPVQLGENAAGASAQTPRFIAFTTMLVKSITVAKVTAGTSTTFIERSLVVRAGGTSTETAVLTTLGSTGYANVTSTLTLTQGDGLAVLTGSDATEVVAASAELLIQPGGNVTS